MELTVRYEFDAEKREIHIPVRVDSQLKVWTPPVAVPAGVWKMCWKLDSNQYAHFVLPGVKKSDSSVPDFTLECCAEELKGDYCPALGTNAVDKADCCPFEIWLETHDNGKKFSHDPTIAVTKDPLDPPTSYGK